MLFDGVVYAFVGIAEIAGGIPHLQVEIFSAMEIVQVTAATSLEDLRSLGVVDGVAVRTDAILQLEQPCLGFGNC